MMTPAGFRHGEVAAGVIALLRDFVKRRALGVVTSSETGFQIGQDPDTVRAPDAAFVLAERVPPSTPTGFFAGAPDLAVEVLSPTDRPAAVNAKIRAWLDAGSQLVWVIDPQSQTIAIHAGVDRCTLLRQSDTLTGGDLLPGFAVPVEQVFASA